MHIVGHIFNHERRIIVNNKIENDTQNGNHGNAWLSFLTHWRYMIVMFFTIINILSTIASPITYKTPFDFVSFIIFVIYFIIITNAFSVSEHNTPEKYNRIYVALIADVIVGAYISSANYPTDPNNFLLKIIAFMIIGILLSVLWFLPNFVYVEKRKFLFFDKESDNYSNSYEKNFMEIYEENNNQALNTYINQHDKNNPAIENQYCPPREDKIEIVASFQTIPAEREE